MTAPSDFVGPYRVLAEVSRLSSSVTYLVEHPAKGPTAPLFLTLWPEIHLYTLEDTRAFAEACQKMKELHAAEFPLLESGVENGTPYILLPEYQASQKWLTLIDQRLRGSVSGAASAVLLQALQETPKSRLFTLARRLLPLRVMKGRRRGRAWVGAIAALLVLVLVISVLYVVVPASGATVTLLPQSKHIQQTLNVVVSTQANSSGDIHGRLIAYTTPAKTQTGKATGTLHHDAAVASGEVVISQITLNDPTTPVDIGSSTIDSNSGVSIVLQPFLATQGGTVTVPAQAEQAGARGNIPAFDINFPVDLCEELDLLCSSPIGHAFAQNPHPFTGGSDAFDQTIVEQSDIDALATSLTTQLTPDAQAGLAQLVTQQVQPGDQTALPAPECMPTVQANHQANDVATQVTVSVTVTCYQIAYAQHDFIPGVIHAQQQQVSAMYGPEYELVGAMLASPPTFKSTDAAQGTATLQVKANSIWAYQVSETLKAMIARQIVGKSSSDARNLVLHMYPGIQDVTIALQGFGSKLPTDAHTIRVVVAAVTGLHASIDNGSG